MRKAKRIEDRFVEELKHQFGIRLKKIILFGSRARGDNTPDSDYDFLLVFDEVNPSIVDRLDDIAGDFLYNNNAIFSAFPVSEGNYKKRRFNPFYMNIKNEGISLS